MSGGREEPRWLGRLVVEAVHADQVREHGGLAGIRDENALESALAQPRQKWHDDAGADLPALAAAYGFGIARNHPFRDGNKRMAFLALVTFLGLNGVVFEATNAEVVTEMLLLAEGAVSEEELAAWVDRHSSQPS